MRIAGANAVQFFLAERSEIKLKSQKIIDKDGLW